MATIGRPDIVISGMGMKLPESDNLEEFSKNLFSGLDMVTADSRRWPIGMWNLPSRSGKLKDLSKFDAQFFGISDDEADRMDPQTRIMIQLTFEAIIDAGLHPQDLKGSRTGVFFAMIMNELEGAVTPSHEDVLTYRQMFCRHINCLFDFRGPSCIYDSACSSSSSALNEAMLYLRTGQLDYAIVAGCNVSVWPGRTVQFSRIGMLSPDGRCNFLDADANGYVKSESCVAMILQKKDSAKRVYAHVINSRVNTDGYKELGITYPSSEIQHQLIRETFDEAGIDPLDVQYVEAHGTGTQAGDTEEVKAIADFFCAPDATRDKPLMIGSVKTNMGHSEAVSGLCSLIKVIIAYEKKMIPPMIHLKNPNPEIKALRDGLIHPIVESTPFDGGYVGVSCYGFGGANSHIILRNNEKEEYPEIHNLFTSLSGDAIPRIVMTCSRTSSGTTLMLEKVIEMKEKKQLTRDFLQLLSEYSKFTPESGMNQRSCTILRESQPNPPVITTSDCHAGMPKVVFVFPGLGCQFSGMAQELMSLEQFSQSITESSKIVDPILKQYGICLNQLLLGSPCPIDMDTSSLAIVTLVAFQLAIVDTLASVGITPDFYVGHSNGELLAGYMDGHLTREQALQTPLMSHKVFSETTPGRKGSMAVVALSWDQVKLECSSYQDLYPACNNCSDTVTIAGSDEDVQSFINRMKERNVFCRKVKSCSQAFHSPIMNDYITALNEEYSKVLPLHPVKRSNKWISTSASDDSDQSMKDYFVNNVIGAVDFYDACQRIPSGNTVIIEISPQPFLTSLIKRNSPETKVIPCLDKNMTPGDKVNSFLKHLGEIYLSGVNVTIENLYAKVEYPVARGTPSLAPLIQWDHSKSRKVRLYPNYFKSYTNFEEIITIDLSTEEWSFISDHVINGRILFPATGYLYLAWNEYSKKHGCTPKNYPVMMKDVKIKRATIMSLDVPSKFTVKFLDVGSQTEFSIEEGGAQVTSGSIMGIDPVTESASFDTSSGADEWLPHTEVYRELKIRGYEYKKNFRMISRVSFDGTRAYVTWSDKWIAFADNILQSVAFHQDTSCHREMLLPVGFTSLKLNSMGQTKTHEEILVCIEKDTQMIASRGVEIHGIQFTPAAKKIYHDWDMLESYSFIPYQSEAIFEADNHMIRPLIDVVIENTNHFNFTVIQVTVNDEDAFQNRMKSQLDTIMDLVYEYREIQPKELNARQLQTCHLFVVTGSYENWESLSSDVEKDLPQGSFVLIESDCDDSPIRSPEFGMMAHRKCVNEKILRLYRKRDTGNILENSVIVNIKDDHFDWLKGIQLFLGNHQNINKKLWLISENSETCGILGFVTCLNQEPDIRSRVRCIMDSDTLTQDELQQVIQKDLVMNVRKKGVWGSYRHVELSQDEMDGTSILTDSALVNIKNVGDLTSFRWYQLNNSLFQNDTEKIAEVHYASLNFRDVMLATGKLPVTALPGDMRNRNCVIGSEFSGIQCSTGRKIMGVIPSGGFATKTIIEDSDFVWSVPDDWSLEEASSVPLVYATAYYALIIRGRLNRGEKVLIHSGAGGVGQAAISICLSYDCEVFTTVGSKYKREYLMRRFPKLKGENFFNSRDTEFEEELMRVTQGVGVDVVLNSLSGDKLQASIRCLSSEGRFLEIGKFDLSEDTPLRLTDDLNQNQSFHGILLDSLFGTDSDHPIAIQQHKKWLHQLIEDGIRGKVIRPLETTVFNADQIEDAFRFMASGKHIGKVVLRIRDQNNNHPQPVEAFPQTSFDPYKVYIIIGGLGGFALQMVQWMIEKGAKQFVLTSRSGITTSFQKYLLKKLNSMEGLSVTVSQLDVSKEDDTIKLIKGCQEKAPVGGIFNLAMVLRDAIIQNQTTENFTRVTDPKVKGTLNLDKISRVMCHQLEYFVVFSSISAGKGVAGQSNYGYANSCMERIVEKRHEDGVRGISLSIQWGIIGDVGILAQDINDEDELNVRGIRPQKISSCLFWLDKMLQSSGDPVIACFTPAVKSIIAKHSGQGDDGLISRIAHIIGVKDMTLMSAGSDETLGTLGIDSLMTVEIRQVLERYFEGQLFDGSAIRSMKVSQLHQMISDGL